MSSKITEAMVEAFTESWELNAHLTTPIRIREALSASSLLPQEGEIETLYRWRGPKGGWIYDAKKPSWHSETLEVRPALSLPLPVQEKPVASVPGWQPIETAEKSLRKRVLLFNGRRVYEGCWGAAKYNRKTKEYDYAWVSSPYSGDTEPTHWMPMPSGPSTVPEAQGGHIVAIDLMQRIWANLYYDEEEAGNTFQSTLNDVVGWLAARDALPALHNDEGNVDD